MEAADSKGETNKEAEENVSEEMEAEGPIAPFARDDEGVSFGIAGVELARDGVMLWDQTQLEKELLRHGSRVEASSLSLPAEEGNLVFPLSDNALVSAVYMAFASHYPLALSPDAIWITIVQGFALHVSLNAESLRKKFVSFEGKKKLIVTCPEFRRYAGLENDWPKVFPQFCEQIAAYTGQELCELVTCSFSTTGVVEKVASEIALMSTMQHYFEYEMMFGCGHPSVRLLGKPSDWEAIRKRVDQLTQYGLDWWVDELRPVLDHFVAAANGRPDLKFWRSITAYGGGSGVPVFINGWIAAFFPYVLIGYPNRKLERNPCLRSWRGPPSYSRTFKSFLSEETYPAGLNPDMFPQSVSSAPFKCVVENEAKTYDMKFASGFFGVWQNKKTLELRPVIGWAVLDE